jgi:hypothetical protein
MAAVESASNLPSTSNTIGLASPATQQAQITAEIRVVEQPQQISTSSISGDEIIPVIMEEPEQKKRKSEDVIEKGPTTSKRPKSEIVEKLENRLGGILCCAVCLDLPKTAMYQVSTKYY